MFNKARKAAIHLGLVLVIRLLGTNACSENILNCCRNVNYFKESL